MIARSLRLDDEVYYALVDAAHVRNVSFNWLVQKLCQEGLERLEDEIKITK